jgi:hypothetical protein
MSAASRSRAPCRRIRLPEAWYAQHTLVVMWRRHLRVVRPLAVWTAAGAPMPARRRRAATRPPSR